VTPTRAGRRAGAALTRRPAARAGAVAVMLRLSFRDAGSGGPPRARGVPGADGAGTVLSDNYFTLVPGEARTVLAVVERAAGAGALEMEVRSWNAETFVVPVQIA
jgi:hypothetical protein